MVCFLVRTCIMLVVITTIYTATENSCHIEGTDMPGYDIQNVYIGSFSECKRACSREPRCKAVVYYPQQNECHLKDSYTGSRNSNVHAQLAVLPCQELFTYCPNGRHVGSDYKTCQRCPSHTYGSGGRTTSCTKCPAGTQSTGTGATSSSSCTPCPTGHYGSTAGAGCEVCPANTFSRYSRSAITDCTPCKAGTTSMPRSSRCSSCKAGQYGPEAGAGCRECPANFYSGRGAESCTPCPTGKYSPAGSTSSSSCDYAPCSAGDFMTENGCQQCEKDTYSGPGASSCIDCPPGKISNAGSTNVSDCYYARCSAGDFMTDNGCLQCKNDTYSGPGASSCIDCPPGRISNAGSTDESDCYFAPCSAGEFITENGCQQCKNDTYSGPGASSCSDCPTGKISNAGSTNESDCSYAPCSAGDFMTENGCQQCRNDTFSGPGASFCTGCPSGKVSNAGSTNESDCYFAPCSAGDYMTENGCQQCRNDTFSGPGASFCTGCPSGKVSNAGSTNESDCYFAPCSAGDYMTGNGCQQCKNDTYSGPGASSCIDCPPGKISNAGSTNESDCYFAPCSAGDFKTENGCQQCKNDTYSGPGASFCTKCPSGKVSNAGSTNEGDCNYAPCSAGDFKTENGCQQCKNDTYSGPGASFCTKCPTGKISNAGSTNESDCYYAPCFSGDYMTDSGCRKCKENTYSSDGASSCTKCPVYTPSGSSMKACFSEACESRSENDPEYGNYSWPNTLPGFVAIRKCQHNSDRVVTKRCDKKTGHFGPSNFENCTTKVHQEISVIQNKTKSIKSTAEQQQLSEKIKDVVETQSKQMKSEDLKKLTDVIENLLEFEDFEGPGELREEPQNGSQSNNVKTNILKIVDDVHKLTEAKEIAKSDVATRIRRSVDKLTEKISAEETDQVFLKGQTVGLIITGIREKGEVGVNGSSGESTVFAVFGDEDNYTRTELENHNNTSTKPFLVSINVPVDEDKGPVTVVLYNSPKFFPDEEIVEDVTHDIAEQLMDSTRVTRKVVSMVTEINYAKTTGRIDFDSKEFLEIKYSVQAVNFTAYYKMNVKTKYECSYYNTTDLMWAVGDQQSGCTTTVEEGDKGEKLVSCKCNHMTSFAVLMSFESDYDPMEASVTSYLLGISFGGLVFTIIAYLPAKEMLKSRPVRLNLLLASSLIFSIVAFYFMELAVMNKIMAKKVPSESETAPLPCVIVSFFMNYFWLCQMAWMVCEALVMYRSLVSAVMNSHIHKYMLKFNLACWGGPLIFPIVGVAWSRTDFANPKTCFLRQKYGLVTFYGPVVLCTVLNIFLFIRISWSTFTKKNIDTGSVPLSTIEKQKRQLKFAITVMTLFGVGWIFGFFLIFLEKNTIFVRWLFILSNSTQGIFIFVLYVLLNRELRKVWTKLLKLSPKSKTSSSGGTISTTLRGKKKTGRTDKIIQSDQQALRSLDGSPNVQHRPRSWSGNGKPRPYSMESDVAHL